jgi:hypothetical protein
MKVSSAITFQITLLPLFQTSFPFHCLPIVLAFDTVYSELLTASLNKTQIKTKKKPTESQYSEIYFSRKTIIYLYQNHAFPRHFK